MRYGFSVGWWWAGGALRRPAPAERGRDCWCDTCSTVPTKPGDAADALRRSPDVSVKKASAEGVGAPLTGALTNRSCASESCDDECENKPREEERLPRIRRASLQAVDGIAMRNALRHVDHTTGTQEGRCPIGTGRH
eukprot:7301902-Prymnesium_polylepis.1